TVLTHAGEAELAGDEFPVEHDGRSGERTGTERENIGSLKAITQTVCVPLERLHLREQIMREKDRLCSLQVGVTRHYDINIFFSEHEQRVLQLAQASCYFCDLQFDVETQVERDLVVAAAR